MADFVRLALSFPSPPATPPDPSGWESGPRSLRPSSLQAGSAVSTVQRFCEHGMADGEEGVVLHAALDHLPVEVVARVLEQVADDIMTPGGY